MRKWLAELSGGKAQYLAGGAVWTLAVTAMLAFGYGGCFARGTETSFPAPGRVALVDFADFPAPGMDAADMSGPSTATGKIDASAPALAASFWSWLVDNPFVAAVTPALLYGLNLLRRWLSGKRLASALLETGVAAALHAYHTFVRHAKTENNGKLTEDQKEVALTLAIGAFRDMAKERGLRIGKEVAKAYIPVLIEQGVNWLKRDAGVERSA